MDVSLKAEFNEKNVKNVNILTLKEEILTFQKNHLIVELIKLCDDSSKETSLEAQYAVYKVFSQWFASGLFSKPKKIGIDSSEMYTYSFVREKYVDFSSKLLEKLSSTELEQQGHAFTLLLQLIRDESDCEDRGFVNDMYYRVLKSLLLNGNTHIFFLYYIIKEYLDEYTDLQYYFYKNSYKLIKEVLEYKDRNSNLVEIFSTNLMILLVNMKAIFLEIGKLWISCSDSFIQSFHISKQKRIFSDCWVIALQLPLKNHQYKQILNILHSNVLPFLSKPHLLMDFLTDSYNAGGSVSILALNGLFYLIKEYNLDYPNFFIKLYALFDENLFHIRYRSRFIKMVDLFLSSTHLPAIIVASFIKRMSRLSLFANPGGIIMIIPLIYNLLKRHPTCIVLIHRNSIKSIFEDPFLEKELDPSKTRALDSSLWELYTLVDHYYPVVSTLVKVFSEQFTKPNYNLGDFLDYSYSKIIDLEINRKIRKLPPIEYQSADGTFVSKEGNSRIFTSLWDLSDISM
ncbi:hypothetical protein PORY_000053 [Pneumocystis oryctolagi]|uniref:Uncharacterized protein n=1 Tax=Pneumocystis oryctolagi TaxID=42067 RepID=A0ACB7CEW4_9ASCO|nr:hypothetical protein PORY_000053 [Pneumocystis oryctolagi]